MQIERFDVVGDTTVVFPESGFTRRDVEDYYDAVAKVLLPHLRARPLSFRRFPSTIHDEAFWEKDAPSFTPAWVKRVEVARREDPDPIRYIVAGNRRTLRWLASVGAIELHPFLHRAPKLDTPTAVVFDLDPGEGAGVLESANVARLLRESLSAVDLESYAKVSGSKGVQVHVPLNVSGVTHEMTEAFARTVARELARTWPRLVVDVMTKAARRKKVFIDWSQNAGFKTNVAVYSLRAKRPDPWVSAPVEWRELDRAIRSGRTSALDFSPEATLRRIEKKGDLFEPVLSMRQQLPASFRELFARTAVAPARRSRSTAATGKRLPKKGSQSGRRLFTLNETELGNELWIDVDGKFRRWILRPDREGGTRIIAVPAGQFPVADSWYRGEVQPEYRDRVKSLDLGSCEVVDGSFAAGELRLHFEGKTLTGEWTMRKIAGGTHKSWELAPQRRRER